MQHCVVGPSSLSRWNPMSTDLPKGETAESDGIKERQTDDAADNRMNEGTAAGGQHSEILESQRTRLALYIDTDHGLLDELCMRDVIAFEQAEEIRSKTTIGSRVDHLLSFVVKLPDERQDKFLVALDNSHQAHIVEFIRVKRDLSSLNRDSWPLRACDEMKMFEKNWVKLV